MIDKDIIFGLYDLDWTKISSLRFNLIDPTQNINYLSIKSRWQWYDGILDKVNFSTHITTDSFDSSEHIIKINTQIRVPFFNQYLEIIPDLELVNTSFLRDYYNYESISFQNGLGQLELKFLNIGRKLKFSRC